MSNFRFSGVAKHGKLVFSPGIVYSFEDVDAVPYCDAMGWGETTDAAAQFNIPSSVFDVDPLTVFASGPRKGQLVLGGDS